MRRQLLIGSLPGLVDIAAKHGQHLAARVDGVVPAGHGVERHVEPSGHSQFFQARDVIAALAWAGEVVFVLDLHADDGPAVLPQQAFELLRDLRIQQLDAREVGRVIAAQRDSGLHQPVGQAAVAHLGVRPGPDAHHDFEPLLLCGLHEAAQVTPALPVEAARRGLVVAPDHIAGHDVDAGAFHLGQLGGPLRVRDAAVVQLAHGGQPGLSGERELA